LLSHVLVPIVLSTYDLFDELLAYCDVENYFYYI